MPDFDKELREKVLRLDCYKCQICGDDQSLEVAHLSHRGQGGQPSRNVPENLITLCKDHHDQVDHKAYPWRTIEHWDRSDKKNGLLILDEEQRRMPNDEIYFYSIPSREVIDQAHQVHSKLLDRIDTMSVAFNDCLELLYYIRGEELYQGITDDNGEFYKRFSNYYEEQVRYKFTNLSLKSVQTYLAALPGVIEREDNEEERKKIKRGNLPNLASVLNDNKIPEQKKKDALELAKGNQDEFEKYKRDLKLEYSENHGRVKTCFSCVNPEYVTKNTSLFSRDGDEVKICDKPFRRCPYKKLIIDTMSSSFAEDRAKNCKYYEPAD